MALQFVAALYAAFFITFPSLLANEIRKENPREWGIRGALLAFMIAAWCLGPMIDGLEYEDAYVHLAAAKFQVAHLATPSDGFYVLACVVGSTKDCMLTATYGTQLIGFSTLLTIFLRLGVPWFGLANAVSYVATIFTVQITWTLLRRYARIFPSCIGIFLLLTCPAFYVVAGSGFAEPLYTFLLLSWLLIGLIAQASPSADRRALIAMLAVGGLLMVVVKKEGVLLVGLMLLWSLWRLTFEKGELRKAAAVISVVCAGIILVSLLIFRIGDAEIRHSADIGTYAFNPAYALRLLPAMLEAAIRPSFFGVLWIGGAIFIPIAFITRNRPALILMAVVAGFISLYCVHARTGAFAQGASVEPAAMTRYLFTLSPLVALFSGMVFGKLGVRHTARETWLARGLVWVLFTVVASTAGFLCLIETDRQRMVIASDERRERFLPLEQEYTSSRTVVITPYSLALYSRGPTNLKVVSAVLAQTNLGRAYLSISKSSGLQILQFEP